MSNPFIARFNSKCQSCGEEMYEDETNVYVVDGLFICEDCAQQDNNVCHCGNYKKTEYATCFECRPNKLDSLI